MQVTPDQVEWVAQSLDEWAQSLMLTPPPGTSATFCVDLADTQGLKRTERTRGGGRLMYLDATPVYTRVVEQMRALPDQAGGVPRGPSREAPLLEHDHVTAPEGGQVIGDAGADNAAADDDDGRLARKRGHRERLRARSKMSKLRSRR